MRTLYEPSNAVEAHMLCDLLTQEGIAARVQGEHLQGGIGELPAAGLVRVMVDEADYERGRAVIDRWETVQPADGAVPPVRKRSRFFVGLLLGGVLGVTGSYAYFRSPVTVDGVDHNGDGLLDETYTYAPSGLLLKVEIDRNLDRRVDQVIDCDRRGLPAASRSDDDFDGRFESRAHYRAGQIESSETDTDGDGYPDLRMRYTGGVMSSVQFIDPSTGLPLREEFYELGVLKTAHVDTDRDGRLETRLRYSPLGDVMSRDLLPQP
jgi:hypothetical protein